jgi:hypothetical protein
LVSEELAGYSVEEPQPQLLSRGVRDYDMYHTILEAVVGYQEHIDRQSQHRTALKTGWEWRYCHGALKAALNIRAQNNDQLISNDIVLVLMTQTCAAAEMKPQTLQVEAYSEADCIFIIWFSTTQFTLEFPN